jgi:hypothetical protein
MALASDFAAEGGDSSRHEDSGSTLHPGSPKRALFAFWGWRRGLRRILIQSIEEVNEPFKTVVAQRKDIRLLCAQLSKTMHRNGSDNPVLLVA